MLTHPGNTGTQPDLDDLDALAGQLAITWPLRAHACQPATHGFTSLPHTTRCSSQPVPPHQAASTGGGRK
jgi:hypothetical protein